MAQKGYLAVFGSNLKGAKSLKPERPRQPKLVYMHSTSTPTCMNFLRQFYLILFSTSMGKGNENENEKKQSPKLGAHVHAYM